MQAGLFALEAELGHVCRGAEGSVGPHVHVGEHGEDVFGDVALVGDSPAVAGEEGLKFFPVVAGVVVAGVALEIIGGDPAAAGF